MLLLLLAAVLVLKSSAKRGRRDLLVNSFSESVTREHTFPYSSCACVRFGVARMSSTYRRRMCTVHTWPRTSIAHRQDQFSGRLNLFGLNYAWQRIREREHIPDVHRFCVCQRTYVRVSLLLCARVCVKFVDIKAPSSADSFACVRHALGAFITHECGNIAHNFACKDVCTFTPYNSIYGNGNIMGIYSIQSI